MSEGPTPPQQAAMRPGRLPSAHIRSEVRKLLQYSGFNSQWGFFFFFSFLTTGISNITLGMYTQQVFKDVANDKSIQKG